MKSKSVNPKTLIYCIPFIILSFFHTSANAQDTEYWFVAPDASFKHSGCDRPTFIMITTGSEPADVTISMPKNSNFADTTQAILPNSSWQYYFGTVGQPGVDVVENSVTTAGIVTDKGIHIKSTSGPVSVYYQVDGSCSKDIFTLKGKKALGAEFYTPFQSKYPRNSLTDAYAQIHIVATEDNTVVDILPKLDIVGGSANVTKTITLNRGESFLVREATRKTTSSLAGSHIKTRDGKQIAVTVVDDCLLHNGSYDVTGDQIVPINNLGTNYVVIKGFSSNATDNVYILATEDNTQIFVNGNSTAAATINKGQTHHIDMGSKDASPDALYIRTSKPAYCYQQSAIASEMGAALLPSMYSIASKKIIFHKQNMTENQLFLIFRQGTASGFRINSATPSITPIAVPGLSDWQYARVSITSVANGQCVVENMDGVFAMGYFCGGGGTALYGFLSNFGQLEFDETTYKCIEQPVILDAGYAKSYKWWKGKEGDEATATILSTGSSYTVPADEPGFYTVLVDQDPYKVYAHTQVVNDAFKATTTLPSFVKKGSPQSFSATVNRPAGKSYSWAMPGASPASTTGSPVSNVQWNTVGSYNVNLKINNDDLHCDTTLTKTVIVYDINDDEVGVPKNQPSTVDVLANDDFSACSPTLSVATGPSHGTATVVDNKIIYTPTTDYIGNDQITYKVSCGAGMDAAATLNIKVNSSLIVINEAGNNASEPSTAGKFIVKFSNAGFKFDKPLKVYYQLGGTAICTEDYLAPTNYTVGTNKGFVTLPANAESVPLSITPIDNFKVEGNDRLITITITEVEVLP